MKKMLEIHELLNIFGDLKPKNKEVLYNFLVNPKTYENKEEIEDFIQILKEMKDDLLYYDPYFDKDMSESEEKFLKLVTGNNEIRRVTIKMEELNNISEEEYQYWKECIEEEYNAIMTAGFEKIGIITYYFDLENEETLSEAEADNEPMGEERIEKWDDQTDSKFELWAEIVEYYKEKRKEEKF